MRHCKTALPGVELRRMETPETPEAVKKYMAEIGRRGGKANKGKCAEKCRAAARARWAKVRAARAKENPSEANTEPKTVTPESPEEAAARRERIVKRLSGVSGTGSY